MSNVTKLLAVAMSAASALSAWAVPAKPGPMPFRQSDGSEINIRIYGDEFHHFTTTEDGYLVVERDNRLYYADVDAQGRPVDSGIQAMPVAQRDARAKAYLQTVNMNRVREVLETKALARDSRMAQTTHYSAPAFAVARQNGMLKGPGLFPGAHFPNTGSQKGLVILVNFSDSKMQTDNPKDYFTRMMNETGFSDYGGTGCAQEYFKEVSGGKFMPEFDVYGPVDLPHDCSYYGSNDIYGNDRRPAHMVKDACDLLDDEIDFSQYDRDGDGEVDNVFVFYAGRGEASGGSSNTIWPHSWNVEAGVGEKPKYDGVKVSRYACSNEWNGSRPDGVGTFIHEFSHVMGLPDLYATSYTSSFTPGAWSCMDYGPYNNDGCTPPLYGVFERYALGWLDPVELTEPANITLPAIGDNVAAIVKNTENEFFLFENRQQTGWDKYIPGHGMLIWHVDYKESVWNSNKVNNTPSHQYVDLEEADNIQSEYTRAGDAFPGTGKVTEFTDDTKPGMKTWAKKGLETPITEIAETDGVISFKVKGGREEERPVVTALEADDIADDSFTARWEALESNPTYLLSVYQDLNKGRIYALKDQPVENATSFRVTGLMPETTYTYTLSTGVPLDMSEPSNPITVTTTETPWSKNPVETSDPEPENISHDSFTVKWQGIEGATDYLLTLEVAHQKEAANAPAGNEEMVFEPVDGYTDFSAGNVTSYTFTGLEPERTYRFTIKATDGTLTTPVSEPVYVTTLSVPSGILGIPDGEKGTRRIYTPDGRELRDNGRLQRGIYIIDGRKVRI